MAVSLLDLPKQNEPYFEQMRKAFDDFLVSGQYVMGSKVTGFEEEFAAYIGVSDAIAVSSGTDALLLALMALEIGPGDEVICPSFTFFATAGVVHRVGATPVFADIEADSFNIDPDDISTKITEKTKAIIPVHLFGQCADMTRIHTIAEAHKLHVIEDSAQAIGSKHHGKVAGAIGSFGSFSFYPTKNLSAFGDAGLLSTNDPELAKFARILRIHGGERRYYHSYVGGNFRFDPIQGALLSLKLPGIDCFNEKRHMNAQAYWKHLSTHVDIALAGTDEASEARIILPSIESENNHTWHQFTIRVKGEGTRDALSSHLQSKQIGHGVYYPLGLHQQECFQSHIDDRSKSLPVTEKTCEEVLSIPIHPELDKTDLQEVCDAILSFLDQ